MPIDVALIQVSPPDAHGYCSFGVGWNNVERAATRNWWSLKSTTRCPARLAIVLST